MRCNALATFALTILLGSLPVVPLELLAARRRVARLMAVPALLTQKRRTEHNPIGSWLGLHPVACEVRLTLAGIVTHLAIGLGGTTLLHGLVVAVGVHFAYLFSKNLIVSVMGNLHLLKLMKIISIFLEPQEKLKY
jgi:hypothetical protein